MPSSNYKVQFSIAFCERICFAFFPYILVFTRTLDRIAAWRGYPERVRVDNGPEILSTTFWGMGTVPSCPHSVHSAVGKPVKNAYIERFNRTYREDILDLYLFHLLQEVRQLTEEWLSRYNQDRPHEALGKLSPIAFALRVG